MSAVRVRRSRRTPKPPSFPDAPVEAAMTPGQLSRPSQHPLNREPPRSVASVQVLEPVDRHARRARAELEEFRLEGGGEELDGDPEPLDDCGMERGIWYWGRGKVAGGESAGEARSGNEDRVRRAPSSSFK